MSVSIGDRIEVPDEALPAIGQNPFTVEFVGNQSEGPYYQGTWANGRPGVVFPEELGSTVEVIEIAAARSVEDEAEFRFMRAMEERA